MVMVFAEGSRSTPPFAVPPSSWTANWKLAYADAVGVGRRREDQVAEAAGADERVDRDRVAQERQRAAGRQAGDLDVEERVAVRAVAEAEVGRGERCGSRPRGS